MDDDLISATSSARLAQSPSEGLENAYESQLQKYEAEVRNHIKIEQQLKLHIECVQDKLDDTEKLLKRYAAERDEVKEARQEMAKQRDAQKQHSLEVDGLKRQLAAARHQEQHLALRLQELEEQLDLQRDCSPAKLLEAPQQKRREKKEQDLQRNYNQYISDSRTQKVLQPTTSSSLTNHTIHMLNLHGSTDRMATHTSKSTANPPLSSSAMAQHPPGKTGLKLSSDKPGKGELKQYSHTGRDFNNKSALGIVGGAQSEANRI